MGCLFHSCRRQRAFGNPPSPLRGPLPPDKQWGAREYINACHLRRGGQVNVVAGAFFSSILPPPACQGEGDHASLNLACPIYGEGGPRSGGRGPLKNSKW